VEWLSQELTTSQLGVPANLLHRSRVPDTSRLSPTDGSKTATKTSDTPAPVRATALGKMEKAVTELMTKLQQLMETLFQLEAAMRQLVRRDYTSFPSKHASCR